MTCGHETTTQVTNAQGKQRDGAISIVVGRCHEMVRYPDLNPELLSHLPLETHLWRFSVVDFSTWKFPVTRHVFPQRAAGQEEFASAFEDGSGDE